mmetsp:Transcript_6265/g.11402  ORF Transcript_6265/g.11402 Transcript_6265/m.11402 type:complete len:182 (+) Transcript_6265:213-758(+)
MIDPNTNKSGEDYNAYCRRRWGGDGWTYSLRDRGKGMGLQFGGWSTWPNTMNAHRLCLFLDELDGANPDLSEKQKEGRHLALVDKFYDLTYEKGSNISTPEGAAQAVEELGYAKASDAVEWLQKGGGSREVASADMHAKREMDIHGVPFFVIGGDAGGRPVGLSGAQDSRAFLKAFQQVSK